MLYLITNRKIVANDRYFHVIKKAILAGVDTIIVREKDLSSVRLMPIAELIKKMIQDYAPRKVNLIINSNEEVATNVGADGLHLGFSDFINKDKKFKGSIGVSVHSVKEAVLAEKKGAYYVLAGHVFPTKCKQGLDGRGIDFIKSIKAEVDIPVIAIGGITPLNVKKVIETGVDGIAIMSYIMSSDEAHRSTFLIRSKIDELVNDKRF